MKLRAIEIAQIKGIEANNNNICHLKSIYIL